MISMLLPPWFVGILTFATMFVALIFWFAAMLPGILLKLLPVYRWQRLASRYCVWIARNWVASNQLIYRLLHDVASPVVNALRGLRGESALPLADIASLLGYSEPSAFTRAFCRRYGVPPSRMRAQRAAVS